MLRSLALLGLTTLSAAGIAGSIQAQLPRPAFTEPRKLADRLDAMRQQISITPDQRPAWNAFATAMEQMGQARRVPAGDMFTAMATLPTASAAIETAAAGLRGAAARLDRALTPPQRARASALWAEGPML